MTWNVDGLNSPAKKLAIETYLWEEGVDIAVLTESHFIDTDVTSVDPITKEPKTKRILKRYVIANWRNRELEVGRRRGAAGPVGIARWRMHGGHF